MEFMTYAILAGCPVINVPARFSAQGLPAGLQLLARCRGDFACLQFAHACERVTRRNSISPFQAFSVTGELRDGCVCA
jgi:amidase